MRSEKETTEVNHGLRRNLLEPNEGRVELDILSDFIDNILVECASEEIAEVEKDASTISAEGFPS